MTVPDTLQIAAKTIEGLVDTIKHLETKIEKLEKMLPPGEVIERMEHTITQLQEVLSNYEDVPTQR